METAPRVDSRYEGGVAYRFTVDTLPGFLQEMGSGLCTTAEGDGAYKAFPEIDARMPTAYKISIGYWFDRSWVTENRYSPKTFYESVARRRAALWQMTRLAQALGSR